MSNALRVGDTFVKEWRYSARFMEEPDDSAILYIARGDASIAIEGEKTGDAWRFFVSSQQTSFLEPGVASLSIRITKADGRVFTVLRDTVRIKPSADSSESSAAFAEKMVKAIERVLEGGLSADERVAFSSMAVGGRSLTLLSRQELIDERAYWSRVLNKKLGKFRPIRSRGVDIGSILGRQK